MSGVEKPGKGDDTSSLAQCHKGPKQLGSIQTPMHNEHHSNASYCYQKSTGFLLPPGDADTLLIKSSKRFIENTKTGSFQRVDENTWTNMNQQKQDRQDSALAEPGFTTNAEHLRWASERFERFILGILGGWSFLNLLLTYAWSTSNFQQSNEHFFGFFSPIALPNSRIFHCLTAMAFAYSCSRIGHTSATQYAGAWRKYASIAVASLYMIAHLATVICLPVEEQLDDMHRQQTTFEKYNFRSGFLADVCGWTIINLARLSSSIAGWTLVCCS